MVNSWIRSWGGAAAPVVLGLVVALASASAQAATSGNLVTDPAFATGPTNWTSSTGWQACNGAAGSQPCNDGAGNIIFSWIPATVSQADIALPTDIGDLTALDYTITHAAGWFSDASQITLTLYDASNAQVATRSASCASPCSATSLSVSISDRAALAAATKATIAFSDTSGNPWAGNYGAIFSAPVLTATSVVPVPTLSEKGLLVLASLLALASAFVLRRRQH